MSERPVNLIYGGAKVEIELPVTLSLEDIQNWIKNEGDFTASLKENGVVEKFTPNDVLEFKYNSQQSQPALKKLTLDQYHPKKKLIFYIQKVSQTNQNILSHFTELTQLIINIHDGIEFGKGNRIRFQIKENTTIKQIEDIVLKGTKVSSLIYKDDLNMLINCFNKSLRVRDIVKSNGQKLHNKEEIIMILIRIAD